MIVYVVLLWSFNESQVIGVSLSFDGAKRLALETCMKEHDAHGWQWSGQLDWLPPESPDHRDCKTWTRAPQHDSYDIYELEAVK